jgi:cell division septation protein DedD
MAKKQVTKSEKAATVPAETPKASSRTRKTATPAPVEVAADAPRPARGRKAAGAAAPAIPSSSPAAPTAEQIATRAYFRFIERGGVAGNELEDWFAAEADLRARIS